MPGQHPSELAQQTDFERLRGEVAELDPTIERNGILIRELQGKIADLTAKLARTGTLFTQTVRGAQEAYSAEFLGTASPYIFINGTQVMEIFYTPTIDVWMEVTLNVGNVRKKDAAYHYLYGNIVLPGDADGDGISTGQVLETQHSGVNQWSNRVVTSIFKGVAGHPYQFRGMLTGNGGTWDYYRGAAVLWLSAKAWAR